MDGNKKIIGIFIAGIIALTLMACMVQPQGYGGLYVDTIPTVNDTINQTILPLKLSDTMGEASSKKIITTSDIIYRHNVETLLTSISDSLQQLGYQITQLQKQQSALLDTNFVKKYHKNFQTQDGFQSAAKTPEIKEKKSDTINASRLQDEALNKSAQSKSDSVNSKRKTIKIKRDGLETDSINRFKTQVQKDTVDTGFKSDTLKKKAEKLKTETSVIKKNSVKQRKTERLPANTESTRMLPTKYDSIVERPNQMNTQRNTQILKSDTVFVSRGYRTSSLANTQNTDYIEQQQQLRANEDEIRRLDDQLHTMQNTNTRRPRRSIIFRDRIQQQPSHNQQADRGSIQLLQSQNDTIQLLRSQLRNAQQVSQTEDSIYQKHAYNEFEPENNQVDQSRSYDAVWSLQDSVAMLNTRVKQIEADNLVDKAPSEIAQASLKGVVDTTLIVVFYEKGRIQPFDEAKVLKQLKDLSSTKNVLNLTLSGYTDSSGSAIVNKEITNKRLNYLSEQIQPWISKEIIFVQNFGDVYASDEVLSDERRIEIRLLTK